MSGAPDLLEAIVAATRTRVAAARARAGSALESAIGRAPPPRGFRRRCRWQACR